MLFLGLNRRCRRAPLYRAEMPPTAPAWVPYGSGRTYKVADLVVGGEEPLRLAGRLEALHLPLSSPRRLVRVLRPVVEALVPAVLDTRHQVLLRRAVAAELVGDHDARRPALPLQQLAQQAFGGALVTPALHELHPVSLDTHLSRGDRNDEVEHERERSS